MDVGSRLALAALFGTDDPSALDEIERHLRPVELARGGTLYRQEDSADEMHIVVRGRLRVVQADAAGKRRAVAEIGRGQTVGEMALLEGGRRTAWVYAVRDTLLLALDRDGLEAVIAHHPRLVLNVTRKVTARLLTSARAGERTTRARSVALLPHAPGAPAAELARRLVRALEPLGATRVVDAEWARAEGGESPRLASRLDEIEAAAETVVYVAGHEDSPWTGRCLRQADLVLVVARAEDRPDEGKLEVSLAGDEDPLRAPRRELVLLHQTGATPPRATERWLPGRVFAGHHHVRLDREGDVARLGRHVAGVSVGLVLAGGGAPGFAHVGVVRALRERGVPIDAVVGTSIGSIVAAAVALDWDDVRIERECREGFTSRNPLGDYNLVPVVSLSKGRRMEALLRGAFGEAEIEDAWIPFACVSADLSASRQHVHRRGPLWRAVRTSCSVPGVLPPMVERNRLLIDGSSVNNLPVDVARRMGVGRVVAVDLDLTVERTLGYTEIPSSWSLLRRRFLPGGKRLPVPGLASVLMKSTMLAGAERAARVRDEVELYLSPPVQKIGLLRWKAFPQVAAIGYEHATGRLSDDVVGRLLAKPSP